MYVLYVTHVNVKCHEFMYTVDTGYDYDYGISMMYVMICSAHITYYYYAYILHVCKLT